MAVKWWQWILGQPKASNPLLDKDGTFCAQGQKGPVWLLAGAQGDGVTPQSTVVTRTCTIPEGKDLFFPLVDYAYFAFPDDPPAQRTVAFVRAQVAPANMRHSTDLSVFVDNRPLPARSIRYDDSLIFSVTVPAFGLFGQPAGTVDFPCAQAGYYAYVKALRPGKHTVHFTGRAPGRTLVDVTYHLTVARD